MKQLGGTAKITIATHWPTHFLIVQLIVKLQENFANLSTKQFLQLYKAFFIWPTWVSYTHLAAITMVAGFFFPHWDAWSQLTGAGTMATKYIVLFFFRTYYLHLRCLIHSVCDIDLTYILPSLTCGCMHCMYVNRGGMCLLCVQLWVCERMWEEQTSMLTCARLIYTLLLQLIIHSYTLLLLPSPTITHSFLPHNSLLHMHTYTCMHTPPSHTQGCWRVSARVQDS